jgi:hypothetical protein
MVPLRFDILIQAEQVGRIVLGLDRVSAAADAVTMAAAMASL